MPRSWVVHLRARRLLASGRPWSSDDCIACQASAEAVGWSRECPPQADSPPYASGPAAPPPAQRRLSRRRPRAARVEARVAARATDMPPPPCVSLKVPTVPTFFAARPCGMSCTTTSARSATRAACSSRLRSVLPPRAAARHTPQRGLLHTGHLGCFTMPTTVMDIFPRAIPRP